jgi:hypothetical protein
MKVLKISVDCINCGEAIFRNIGDLNDNDVVNLSLFEQSDWDCDKCDHTTVTGDLETMDSEDL